MMLTPCQHLGKSDASRLGKP